MPVDESLRSKKARQTRSALHESAISRVLADGLACTTVAAIAADAGVSTRTFFNYYETKEDAIVGLGVDAEVDGRLADDYVHSDAGLDTLAEDTARFVREALLIGSADPELPARRRRLFSLYPELVSKSFDRAEALEEIITGHVLARLRHLGQEFSSDGSAWRSARMLTQVCRVPLTHAGRTIKEAPATVEDKGGTKPIFEDSLDLFLKVLDRLQ